MPSGQLLVCIFYKKIKFFDSYSSRCLLHYDLVDKAMQFLLYELGSKSKLSKSNYSIQRTCIQS